MVDDIFTLVRDRGAIAAVRYSFLSSALVWFLLSISALVLELFSRLSYQ